jgi:Flp pilus assembly protein TadG
MRPRLLRRSRTRRRGQALAEFALVFPLAILIIIAVFDVGRAVFAYNGLTNAAREGGRLAAVNQDVNTIKQRVQNMTFGTSITNLASPTFVRFFQEGPTLSPVTANPVCPPATMAVGCVAVVNAESNWSAITPIIGQIIGPITFKSDTQVPVEFVCPNPAIPAYATADLCPKQP